ncbi:dihydroxyacetone kinase subunit DhaK [Streptomyces sp. NPDC002490]|uniref:dihydroxyacetone kinase subunit DhaK n=1 Tax=Streptomyces sp. NPDC002490 TaxID=3154416 RepID=UPI0033260C87
MSYFLPDDEAVLAACQGLALAHPGIGLCVEPLYLLASRPAPQRRIALVAGGGAGHEPLHTGLLGRGGLDAVVPGPVFTSPGNAQIVAASHAAASLGQRDGVVHIVKNYTGDRINFALAADQIRAAGIPVAEVVVDDDLATEHTAVGRRGTGATVVVEKLLGALADQGADLDGLAELGTRVAGASRSLAVCARAHTSPGDRSPSFRLDPRHFDFGIGIHGERAARTIAEVGTDELVARMLDELLEHVRPGTHGVVVVVSGLGGTSELELRAVGALAHRHLVNRGARVHALAVGTYISALDMAGFTLTLTALAPGWAGLWDLPTDTPLRLPGAAAFRTTALPPAHGTSVTSRWDAPAPPRAERGARAFLDELHRISRLSHAELTELDRATGDGDFGDNFCGGVTAAVGLADRSGAAGTEALADTFRNHVGGTSGPLFGVLFTALAPVADRTPPDVPALATALRRSLSRITTIGGAAPGDCTLVDALAPAADALAATPLAGPERALTAAARAAIAGAHATAALTARRGRASYADGYSEGRPDPGAVAVALVLTALARVHEPLPAGDLPSLPRIARGGAEDVS